MRWILRVLFKLVGVALVLWPLGQTALFYLGTQVPAHITALERDGVGRENPTMRHRVAITYTYADEEGERHEAKVSRSSSRAAGMQAGGEYPLRYVPFLPAVAGLEAFLVPTVGSLVSLVSGALLLVLFRRRRR
jgi:hypothetical protein